MADSSTYTEVTASAQSDFKSNVTEFVKTRLESNLSPKVIESGQFAGIENRVAAALVERYKNSPIVSSKYLPNGPYDQEPQKNKGAIDLYIASTKEDVGNSLFSPNLVKRRDDHAFNISGKVELAVNGIVDKEYQTQMQKMALEKVLKQATTPKEASTQSAPKPGELGLKAPVIAQTKNGVGSPTV